MRRRWGPLAVIAAAIALGCTPGVADAAHLALGGATQFPARTLVLSGVKRTTLAPVNLHITENGQPVAADSVEPASAGRRGELGVVLVIDRSPSMAGAPSDAALQAAQTLAAERLPNQELGIVSFDATPTVTLPLTTDSSTITQSLSGLQAIGSGTHILPALSLAIHELWAAKVKAGSVILLSDGADREPMNMVTPESVAAQARAAHVQIFTVGLRDRYYTPASMQQLAQIGGGQFTEALTASALKRIFSRIQTGLVASWLISYRSTQPLGHRVSVHLRVDGVPGLLTASYLAPPAPTAGPGPVTPHRAQPFWQSTLALDIIVGLCALLLFLGLWFVLRRRGSGSVTRRVDGFVASPQREKPEPGPSLTTAAAQRTRDTFSKRAWWPAFAESLDIAMIAMAPEKVILYTAAGGCMTAALLWLALGSVVPGLLALLLAPFALRAYIQSRMRRQRDRFADLLPSHLEEIAAAIRAGRSLVEALTAVNHGAEEPLQREFSRALGDENLGRPLDDTLQVISLRMASEGVDQMAVVAAMHRSTGSSVSEALDRVAEGARGRADLKRELSALTAQGRLARWILTFLPPVILLIMQIISPRYVRPLLHTTAGVVSLAVAAGLVVAGSLVMKRIVDIEV